MAHSARQQQASHTTYQLLSPSCSTRAWKKCLSLYGKCCRIFWKTGEQTKKQQQNQQQQKAHTKSKRTLQKYERGDSRWNQMPALRFQIGEKHQRSLVQPPFGVQLPMKHLILFYQLNHRLRRQLLAWKCDNNTSMAVCLDSGQRTF